MSILLPTSALLPLTNDLGAVYKALVRTDSTIDIANAGCQTALSDLATNLVSSDPQQFASLTPALVGTYGSAPGAVTTSTSPFGAISGQPGGSFGTGQGLINRLSILNGGFFACLETIRKAISSYGTALGAIDLGTYAAYRNGLSAYSCLYTPDFAALYWYAYRCSSQLAAASVFAPAGLVLASWNTLTDSTGLFLPGSLPTASGYALAPLAVGCGSITITGANTCSTAGLTGTGDNAIAYVSTEISGGTGSTAVVTITDSAGATFSATVTALAAGSIVAFVPTVAGTVMATPSSATVAGTATSGEIQIVQGGPTVDEYGNQVWPGGLPMAQGYSPIVLPSALVGATGFNATSTITVTAPDAGSAGASKTWTFGVTSGSTTGTNIVLSLGTAVGRMAGPPTGISISGAATEGDFTLITN